MKRLLLTFGLVAIAAISAVCSTASAQPQASVPANAPVATVVAKDTKFQTATVEVQAGQAFTLHFDNRDGAPHNVGIYTDSGAGTPVSVGEIVSSGAKDQAVPALKAGTYFFRCDVHHDMTGTIVAE